MERRVRTLIFLVTICLLALAMVGFAAASTDAPAAPPASSNVAWWVWPLSLFVVTFLMGIVAVLGGVGGGVLFVPIIGGFFPFHLDFVRGAGLLVALAGALAAGPGLLKKGMADLRLAMPVAVIASACAIVGAMVGLALPTNIVQTALGATILGIVGIMIIAKKSEYPEVKQPDALSTALRINGIYHEVSSGHEVNWHDPQDTARSGDIYYHRCNGGHVRPRRRMGECPGAQPDDGSSLKSIGGNEQIPAFHY